VSEWAIRQGDARAILREVPEGYAQTVVTSPPYWGLRDYKLEPLDWEDGWRGCLGLEPTPDLYVQHLVSIFREVRRVLRDDGTVWLNLGDSYASTPPGNKTKGVSAKSGLHGVESDVYRTTLSQSVQTKRSTVAPGLKPKDLVGIPWMVAFALRADGWYLRSDIIWAKGYSFHPTTAGSCMPESIKDRPTRGHEYLFLLTKSAKYYYDAEAVKEAGKDWTKGGPGTGIKETRHYHPDNGGNAGLKGIAQRYKDGTQAPTRNLRSVWLINPKPFREAHFATFPPALVDPCIKAGSRPGDVVLDPFAGSGTVGVVALPLERHFLGLELNPDYIAMAARRLRATGGREV